jgi:DNA-binding GntR family transcriptional regulator
LTIYSKYTQVILRRVLSRGGQAPKEGIVRLSEKAYHLIRHRVVTLELAPLSFIDEQALMQDLQLGRTPIREALQRLAAEGLVFLAPRRGMYVADISITDLQKIFEMRLAVEGLAARLAADRISNELLDQMQAVMAELAEVADDDGKALMLIDERFHMLLYQAADNEFLAETCTRLHAQSCRLWHLVLERLVDVRSALEQHWGTLEALRARDGDGAESLLRVHILEFQQRLKAVI